MTRVALIFGLLCTVLVATVVWLRTEAPAVSDQRARPVTDVLGSDKELSGFARAIEPAVIRLPKDHGPHPRFRSEWWYFSGNLADEQGAEFGFQLTFFRYALSPEPPRRSSSWAANQIFMAHFAISDRLRGEHRVAERFARGALELAGARGRPFVAWLDDWTASSTTDAFLPLELIAQDRTQGLQLSLTLETGKPAVLQGENGLSQKSPEPGQASYYYSYTRLPARGVLAVEGQEHRVRGLAWLDREWSTSSLGPDLAGWDWFGVHLDDGRDLMLYALRDRNGVMQPLSAGSLVTPDGRARHLAAGQFQLRPATYWRSAATGVRYPVEWELQVPSAGVNLSLRPMLSDQEQDLTVRYWEGSVDALDADSGRRVGRGYMELTGY